MTGTKPTHEQIMNKIENSINTDGICHLWVGKFKKSNPQYRNVNIRRYLWNLSKEKLSRCDILITTCNDDKCVNVDHLQIRSREIIWEEVLERLENNSYINKKGCMIWNKSCNPKGYGKTSLKHKCISAHRLSYMIKIGGKEIPDYINGEKTVIRHSCNEPGCINPDHLDIGTQLDNSKDKRQNNTGRRGESNNRAKIKESLARKIKLSRRERGEPGYKTQKERAKLFGVLIGLVSSIDSGQTWSYLPDINGKNHNKKKEELNTKKRMKRKLNIEQELKDDDFKKIGDKLYSNTTKTSKNKKGDVDGDCWERSGYLDEDGYSIMDYGGVIKKAHIWSCERSNKRKRLDNEHTRHLCGNPPCVNPFHLRFGTSGENAKDRFLHGKQVSKLDKDKVLEIRKSSLSRKELSEIYMVSVSTIGRAITGESWKHVK